MIKRVPDAFLWLLYMCSHTGVHVTFAPDPTYMHSSPPPPHMHGSTPNTLTSVHTLVQVYNSTKHCIRWLVLGFLLLCLASLKRLIGILPGNEETRIGCYTLGRTYHSFYLHVSSSTPNGQITMQVSLVPNPILCIRWNSPQGCSGTVGWIQAAIVLHRNEEKWKIYGEKLVPPFKSLHLNSFVFSLSSQSNLLWLLLKQLDMIWE